MTSPRTTRGEFLPGLNECQVLLDPSGHLEVRRVLQVFNDLPPDGVRGGGVVEGALRVWDVGEVPELEGVDPVQTLVHPPTFPASLETNLSLSVREILSRGVIGDRPEKVL